MRRKAIETGILALVIVVAVEVSLMSQAGRPSLAGLIKTLALTERGAPGWLSALTRDLEPEQERILAVTTAGASVDSVAGQASHVLLPPAFDARLLQPGANLVLVHNHPNGTGLSGDDLIQLGKPGVFAVAAVGHEGSIYVAIAGQAYDRSAFEQRQYAIAQAHLTSQLLAQQARGLLAAVAADHRTHLASLVLADARVIEYRATLASSRRESFERNRLSLRESVQFAGSRLKAAMKKKSVAAHSSSRATMSRRLTGSRRQSSRDIARRRAQLQRQLGAEDPEPASDRADDREIADDDRRFLRAVVVELAIGRDDESGHKLAGPDVTQK